MNSKPSFGKSFKALYGCWKIVVEWGTNTGLHCEYLSKLGEFYNLPKDAIDCLSCKLSIGLELMALIMKMHHSVLDKLDSVHDNVAWHVGALNSYGP